MFTEIPSVGGKARGRGRAAGRGGARVRGGRGGLAGRPGRDGPAALHQNLCKFICTLCYEDGGV